MRKRRFFPTVDGSLEDRLALSSSGTSAFVGAHVLAAKPVKHPAVTAKQIKQTNLKVDAAFNEFNRE